MVPLISIIVPIFNGEKYVSRIIDTSNNQTLHNFEVICINDGSTDNTGKLLNNFKEQYGWLKVINQDNKGVSVARNTGIRNATGAYIMFLDADDYLENTTIELVTDRITRYEPDLIDFGMYYINVTGNKNPGHHKLPKEVVLESDIIESRIIPNLINVKSDPDAFIYDYSCNKAFKRSIIVSNNIRYIESRRIWEDRPFIVSYLRYAKTYYSIQANLYNYVSVDNSLSRQYDLQFFDIILENYKLYYLWFSKKYDFKTAYVYQYWSRSIENMIMRSLEQTVNTDIILANIQNILKNKIVLSWFENRELKSECDKSVNEFILSGNVDALLTLYGTKLKEKSKKKKINQIKYKLRSLIKR